MNFKTYTHLPPEARALREEVFCKEQGFQEEFDAQDLHCRHGLLWNDQGDAVGVCRFSPDRNRGYGSWDGLPYPGPSVAGGLAAFW